MKFKRYSKLLLVGLIVVINVNCVQHPQLKELELENKGLKKQVDSLKNELNNCDMMIQSYEGMPLSI